MLIFILSVTPMAYNYSPFGYITFCDGISGAYCIMPAVLLSGKQDHVCKSHTLLPRARISLRFIALPAKRLGRLNAPIGRRKTPQKDLDPHELMGLERKSFRTAA